MCGVPGKIPNIHMENMQTLWQTSPGFLLHGNSASYCTNTKMKKNIFMLIHAFANLLKSNRHFVFFQSSFYTDKE